MSETKYIILKLDEASAEAVGQPTVWVQQAEVVPAAERFGSSARPVFERWLEDSGPNVTAAGEYLVARLGGFGAERFTVTPRVEFDVARCDGQAAGVGA